MKNERFVINALGECFRGDDCLVGSVNIRELQKLLCIKRQPTKAEVDAEFDRQAKASLTRKEYLAWKKWGEFSSVQTNLFRIYTGVDVKGKPWASLSTEFIYFMSDRSYKERIAAYAAEFGGTVTVMSELPHSDKSILTSELDRARARGEEPDWRYGKNHGRPERQVSVEVPIWDKNLSEVKKLIAQMTSRAKKTRLSKLWVSVL